MMRILSVAAVMSGMSHPLAGQETAPKWDVEIPSALVVDTPPRPVPEPIDFAVLSSRTWKMDVKEAPPMSGLPPVRGTIDVTMEWVARPALPEPLPRPVPPPPDPEASARWKRLRENSRGTDLGFLSATVYDEKRTLLRIYTQGDMGNTVTAWSNVNFLHFTSHPTYRVNFPDGSYQDKHFFIGISPIDTGRMRLWAARAGREYAAPEIPELPDSDIAGPAFIVIGGENDSPAMDTLEQFHDLYRKIGQELAAAFHAREAEQAARRAWFKSNPPKPSNAVVRFWRRDQPNP